LQGLYFFQKSLKNQNYILYGKTKEIGGKTPAFSGISHESKQRIKIINADIDNISKELSEDGIKYETYLEQAIEKKKSKQKLTEREERLLKLVDQLNEAKNDKVYITGRKTVDSLISWTVKKLLAFNLKGGLAELIQGFTNLTMMAAAEFFSEKSMLKTYSE